MSCKNSYIKKFKSLISSVSSNDKYKNIIIVCAMIGIALIFISNTFKQDNSKEVINTTTTNSSEQYIANLEKNLETIVSNIKGAGNSKVLVTIESTTETVYATEEKKNKEASEDKTNGETTRRKECDDCEKKYITVKDSNGTEKALAVTEIQPRIKGVIVVCAGGDDPLVQQRVINAVTTALNITSKRVCVTKSN